jgi:Acetyltransferase (GNAT) domain
MLAPAFFFASVSARGWRPLVVVVSQGQRIAGLLYCKERVVAGVGIRIAFGNDALGAMVAADPNEMESVTECATNALLKRMFALRFLVSAERVPLLKRIRTTADVSFFATKNHAHLRLPGTFDEFLAKLGPRTRRNFRNFRRKSESAGNKFVHELDFGEFSSASRKLLPNAALARSSETQEKHLAMIGAMPNRLLVGLLGNNSEWIGLAGGWHEGDRAILVMQLNDRARSRESISTVLRSYLIEELIKQGVRELVFWEGTSAPLSAYATYPEMVMAHLDAQSVALRLFRGAWTTARKFAPTNFILLRKWFVRDV